MNFDFDETVNTFRKEIKGLFEPDDEAALAQLENGDMNQVREGLLDWLNRLGKAGYLSLGLDDGKNSVALAMIQESLASISPFLFLAVEMTARIFGRLVAVYGTSEQKDKILLPLKNGNLIGSVALSEEGVSGKPSGKDYLVSSKLDHVVNAPVADWIAVGGKEEEDIVFFLIKKNSEGLSIGQRLPALGYAGTATASISLHHCPVPSECLIGPIKGKEQLKKVRMWKDQILTVASLGVMQRSFDSALGHAKSQKIDGKPIITHQAFGFKMAEMLTLLQTAQLLAYRAAWMAETDDREAAVLAHCAKIFCSESAEKVASQALQVMGEQGFFYDNPAQEGYCNAKYLQIAGTSTEMSRINIGDILLKN